jgi:hypothetical protein
MIEVMKYDKKGKFSFDTKHFNEVVDKNIIKSFLNEDINKLS